MDRIKGFVSVLGLGVVLGVMTTYYALYLYVSKNTQTSDFFIESIFKDLFNLEREEFEKSRYGVVLFDLIENKTLSEIKRSGFFCSKGSYSYNGLEVYNSRYVLATISDKITLKPLLLSSYFGRYYISPENTRSLVIAYSSEVIISGCNYKEVYDKTYNKYVKLKAINVKDGKCEISSDTNIYVNAYATEIKEEFIALNHIALANNIEGVLELLSLPNREIEKLRSQVYEIFADKMNFMNNKYRAMSNYGINIYSVIPIEKAIFLNNNDISRVVNKIKDLSNEERETLYKLLSNGNNAQIEGIGENVKEIVYQLREIENNLNSFFDAEMVNIVNNNPNAINLMRNIKGMDIKTRNLIKYLITENSIDSLLLMDDQQLINTINKVDTKYSLNLKAYDISQIRKYLSIIKSTSLDKNSVRKLLDLDYKYIDLNTYVDALRISSDIYSLEELSKSYKRCLNLDKYRKLKKLMDTTRMSFSYSYTPSYSYKTMKEFGLFDETLSIKDVEVINNLENKLKREFLLTDNEINKLEKVFLKGNISSVRDLKEIKNIYEKIGMRDYAFVIDKLLSQEEEKVKNLIINYLPSYRSFFGLDFGINYCDETLYSSNLFSLEVSLNGYYLLKNGFDAERVIRINNIKSNLLEYKNLFNDLKDLKDINILDIESCRRFLDVRKIISTLLYYSQEIRNPDFVASCYYKNFNDLEFEYIIVNKSEGRGMQAIFKEKQTISFENYQEVLNPYYTKESREDIFLLYEKAIENLVKNEKILRQIRDEIKEKITSLEENEFEFVQFSCGECRFLPNPLLRNDKSKVKQIVNDILDKYKKDINLTVENVEIVEEVENLSESQDLPCLCSDGLKQNVMKLCKTKYKMNRGGKIYTIYDYKGLRFVIVFEV